LKLLLRIYWLNRSSKEINIQTPHKLFAGRCGDLTQQKLSAFYWMAAIE
jgi:hypothetical protein